jgi:hypothetical protein
LKKISNEAARKWALPGESDMANAGGSLLPAPIHYNFMFIKVPGSANDFANGINDLGQVVGQYTLLVDGALISHGFVETNGHFATIDVPGAILTVGNSINNLGQVVGNYQSPTQNHAFLEVKGIFTTIDVPGAAATFANGINDRGQIVGNYIDSSGADHGFMYRSGIFTTFDVPGASATDLIGINDRGQIVGSYSDGTGGHSFVERDGVLANIIVPGSTSTDVAAINNLGQIVGSYIDPASHGAAQGFIDSGGSFITLDAPGNNKTFLTGINDRGQVTGNLPGFTAIPFLHGENAPHEYPADVNMFANAGPSAKADLLPDWGFAKTYESQAGGLNVAMDDRHSVHAGSVIAFGSNAMSAAFGDGSDPLPLR